MTFTATCEWQDVPEDAVLPPGLEIKLDLETGQKQARLADRKPANGAAVDLDDLDRQFAEEAAAQPHEAPPKPDRLRLVPPSEMDWRGAQLNLVKGILGHGMMALLYGESGSAKTLIALSIALHVALGRDWCGRKVQRGFVAYLAPEGGHSVHLRFHAWSRYHGIDPGDDNLPFRTIPVRVDLCKSKADLTTIIANIKAAEAELGPCLLVVVDTVSRALAGAEENSSDAMGCFIVNCDQLREEIGATVLAVHHTPRGGNTPRGSTVLEYGSEIRMRAEKVAHKLFKLTLEHLKDSESGEELLFELESAIVGTNEDGEEVDGGLVVETDIRPAGASGRPPKLNERQLCVINALRKEALSTKKWDFSIDEFNDLCMKCGAIDHNSPEGTVRRLKHDLRMQLANKNYITVTGEVIRFVILS
jgi:AAA domain